LLEIFAALALTLAATGTFAVISYTVTQRTREIGIRGALGATPGRIVALVVSLGLRPVLAGGVLGLLGALAAARLLRSELYETRPSDPVALSAAVAVLLAAALVALLGPAWRAARINPGETLRAE
jgi:putative ABC transport system permease protein